ncbi:thioredoxin domain-containing protein 6 [Lasius niger]|uniref:Thioredoxin domain-containing protein 6 n=1 Tax=Lasius niger TaxID=67767 RepID=A0A0J7NTX4_LASNI|nr:thioredoxin domain-containing protein 6 [Lasius niger]
MKKAGPAALQVEVSTNEEWRQLLNRPGLIIVDVYSDWSGPCAAMASTLRKIKIEVGDAVDYAVARNDDIDDLARFRGRSEPAWMFLQDGKMVNLMFGAHCPRLRKLTMDEIRRVQHSETPKWRLDVCERAPEEEVRWQKQEIVRRALEEKKRAREEAERLERYERFMAQMVVELCENTVLVLYPWVFKDERGRPRDKWQSPPYTELVQDLFRQCFDVQEELRIQLNEDTIERMFVESGVDITKELIKGLTDGKCMAMRLKGKPPHPDWPVHYPQSECPESNSMCPIRMIDDVENYLISIITTQPPPLLQTGIGIGGVPLIRPTYDAPYIERHVHVHEPDPKIEGDTRRVHPAAWVPPQARSKVHVFKTLFPAYMEKAHSYEEPLPPLPLCAFKFEASKFGVVRDVYEMYRHAIEHFGAFELKNYLRKVKYKTGVEVFIVIIRRINEEAFLAFANIEPFFVTEVDEEAQGMLTEYFPEGAEDVILLTPDEQEALYEDEEEEEEDYEEEEEEEFDENNVYPFY